MQDVEGVAEGVGGGAMAAARVGHEDLDGGHVFFSLEACGCCSRSVMGYALEA